MRVAVIGGGISGCCAASTLAARLGRAAITLFESGRGVGGRMATRRLEVNCYCLRCFDKKFFTI